MKGRMYFSPGTNLKADENTFLPFSDPISKHNICKFSDDLTDNSLFEVVNQKRTGLYQD